MFDPENSAGYPELNLVTIHALTMQTAGYEYTPDPQTILRKGLIEEVAEYAWEIAQEGEPNQNQIEGEIGDVLWYVSEISRSHNIAIEGLSVGQSLDTFQAKAGITDVIPIEGADGSHIDIEDQPHIALAVAALRVVDVMNPKNDDLWLPGLHRTSLNKALSDLLVISGFISSKHSVTFSQAIKHTVAKLQSRERKPHVIDEAQASELMTSMRQRLNIHPFVGKLLAKTVLGETAPGHEDELERKNRE